MAQSEWVPQYRRRWPKGLVRYPAPPGDLPDSAREFLSDVGLPLGREPVWVFSGQLLPRELGGRPYLQFGLRGAFPLLLLRPEGTVWWQNVDRTELTFCNGSIEQFAQCLTLACKGDQALALEGLSVSEVVARVRERYESIDTRAMESGTPWTKVLADVEETERERRGDWES